MESGRNRSGRSLTDWGSRGPRSSQGTSTSAMGRSLTRPRWIPGSPTFGPSCGRRSRATPGTSRRVEWRPRGRSSASGAAATFPPCHEITRHDRRAAVLAIRVLGAAALAQLLVADTHSSRRLLRRRGVCVLHCFTVIGLPEAPVEVARVVEPSPAERGALFGCGRALAEKPESPSEALRREEMSTERRG